MKSTIIALLLLLACSTVCLAQCDKKLSLITSKTEHLDGSNNLERAVDEQTVIEIIDKKISVNIENGKQTLTGTIKSNTCDWKTPFKEGKSVINTTISDEDGGGEKDYVLTIEGKDGKVTLTAESVQDPDRKLRFVLDKFEEKK
ncbi:hypothetical protein SAMN05428975_2324 [Mucilaginibacter sp. OK268]|uniref:hypothetical protein n=1 Tax=Mucilaginibacter sp. OK268 TaxID=1881048 RepID=UPI0008915AB8|nr:hypothetical protein [Mucilaginibacter sp. OK268]SDP72200.1 hypothetical protein SAMN05428975_2324 [Mucilaginibacter sp. OK268]